MSRPPEGYHDAPVYLQVEASFGKTWRNGEYVDEVTGIKVVGFTQKRPARPKRGTITAKVTMRMPDGAFLPLAPQAIVVVPENMTVTTPIEVLVEDANPGEDQ